ncbi:MAG TPA: hypothetical protein VMY42_10000 [Thermoguttaceae bacterium]|nr:hypothetical protein [Thermoguttaceae bacterium]
MPVPPTETLAALIREKRDCLLTLREMGRRQFELIDEGNMTALLEVLAAKQRALNTLQRVERALDPFRGQDPERRPWRLPDDRRRCAEQLQQCETLLGEIVSQEKCSEGALIRRRDETAERLQGAHRANHARGAYTAETRGEIHQLDLHSDS